MSTSIVWFRRDLRVSDNPALAAAAAESDQVVPVFCFEAGLLAGRHSSANRNAYLLATLEELDESLNRIGSKMHYRSGSPASVLPDLVRECGASQIHINRDHTAHARERDRAVGEALQDSGAQLVEHDGITCADISEIETGAGGSYKVFTPFFRVWDEAPRRGLVDPPAKLTGPDIEVGAPPTTAELGVNSAAARTAAAARPGEQAGRQQMIAAVDDSADYLKTRDLPGLDRTTRTSIPLHFGTISALEFELLLLDQAHGGAGAEALRRQLAWRDFWMHVIRFHPQNRKSEHQEKFRGMDWPGAAEDLDAWKQGRTGFPLVDAGMRQLSAEGWMHNRARMVVASFLTKNLLVDWRQGESHFMSELLDGDEAQNNGNWQWAAGVGADAAPYFRVFNPARQLERFDPDGSYVRRWVPEVGTDAYPDPIVDLKLTREAAIAHFRAEAEALTDPPD